MFSLRLISQNIDRSLAKSKAARRVALIGTTLCFAVMVIAISIERGFRHSIESRAKLLLSDLRFTSDNSWIGQNGSTMSYDSLFVEQLTQIKGVEQIMAVLEEPAVLQRMGSGTQGILIKGIDRSRGRDTISQIDKLVVQGSINSLSNNSSVAISATMAGAIGAKIGDMVDIVSFNGPIPHKNTVAIGAIYSTSIGDIEQPLVFASIDFVRVFTGVDNSAIGAYEVWGDLNQEQFDQVEELAVADYALRITTAEQSAGELFDWLNMLQGNVLLVLIIMLAVALINITSSSLIFILESTQKIAILRALGMRQKALQQIFMRRSMAIVGRGAAYGVAIGLIIIWLQQTFGIISLDPKNYFVDQLPMYFAPIDTLVVVGLTFIVVGLVVWASTRVVSRIEVSAGLKFE